MKRTATLMTICLMLGGIVSFSQNNQQKDIDAIKVVVARETESFMNVDRKDMVRKLAAITLFILVIF